MIHLGESFKLAKIKYKTRKVRNIFSSFTVSLGITVILVIMIGTAGILSLGTAVFKDSLADRYFATVMTVGSCQEESLEGRVGQCGSTFDVDQFKSEYSPHNFKNITVQKLSEYNYIQFEGFSNNLIGDRENYVPTYNVVVTDDLLIRDYIFKGYDWDKIDDNVIPIIVPETFLSKNYSSANVTTNKDIFELRKKNATNYIGKTFDLEIGYPKNNTKYETSPKLSDIVYKKTNFKVQIVGLIPMASSLLGGSSPYVLQNAITMPITAYNKIPEIKQLFGTNGNDLALVEFHSKEDRNSFLKDANSNKILRDRNYNISSLPSRYEGFTDVINVIRNIGWGVGGFLLAISSLFVLSTVGKIADDSRREIGVFRAFGAKKGDIRKILFSFTMILTTVGYLIGLLFALILDAFASILWGDNLFYSIANMSVSLDLQKPIFPFIGFPFMEMTLLFVFVSLLGMAAAYFPVRKASNIDVIKALRSD